MLLIQADHVVDFGEQVVDPFKRDCNLRGFSLVRVRRES
jgi:hypothetical protein